jgi:hypothetical protein
MASWQLGEIGIDPERAAAALDFFESYGNLCASELRAATRDEESERSDAEIAEDRWVVATDGASAYREAAQWAAALADARAPGLLGQSANLFALTQQAYGLFLGSACQRWDVSAAALPQAEHVRQLATILGVTDDPVPVPEPMHHPQQQAYAFLAAAGSDQLRESYRELLERIGEAPAGRQGSAPVGALGMPVRAYWEVAYALFNEPASGVETIARILTRMGARYATSVESARTNDYLWANGAAAIDVADADIIGIALLTADQFGSDRLRDAVRGAQADRETSFEGQVPIEIALDVAAEGPSQARRS